MKKYLLAVVMAFVTATSALAESNWYDGVTVDTSAVLAIAGIIVVAIGGIWGVKKVIKLMNRS